MELYDKIDKLKSNLEEEQTIIDIKNIQTKIKSNEQLVNKIKSKENVDNIDDIKTYRHLENELNYLILTINSKLKKLEKDSDCNENNSR